MSHVLDVFRSEIGLPLVFLHSFWRLFEYANEYYVGLGNLGNASFLNISTENDLFIDSMHSLPEVIEQE